MQTTSDKLEVEKAIHDAIGWALTKDLDRLFSIVAQDDDGKLVGVAILDNKFIGKDKDQLQLQFLHVSKDYRKQGLGKKLFHLAADKAREMGAKQMYVSATPSENTVNFYLRLGAVVTKEPDPELFALEPEDIHFECKV